MVSLAENVKWYGAFVELAGGEEEAGALMEEYVSTVADEISEVGHYHTGESE